MAGEVLVIHNVTRYCDDVYECVAYNNVPPAAHRSIRVYVECEFSSFFGVLIVYVECQFSSFFGVLIVYVECQFSSSFFPSFFGVLIVYGEF